MALAYFEIDGKLCNSIYSDDITTNVTPATTT